LCYLLHCVWRVFVIKLEAKATLRKGLAHPVLEAPQKAHDHCENVVELVVNIVPNADTARQGREHTA
jgi:hypothetical protein